MAKKIIIPPKRNMKTRIKDVVRKGPQPQTPVIVAQGASKSRVAQVQQSRIPKPAENQRGRIKSKDERDLIR